MEAVYSVRVFPTGAPSEYEVGGVISETDNGSWTHAAGRVDRYEDAFDAFVTEEVEGDDEPAPQRVINGCAVVLTGIKFKVTEDEMVHEFDADLMSDRWQTICTGSHDDATGITAQSLHEDEKVANAVQRASDALDRRVEWLEVISPRSFDGVVDAAEDLLEGDRDESDE